MSYLDSKLEKDGFCTDFNGSIRLIIAIHNNESIIEAKNVNCKFRKHEINGWLYIISIDSSWFETIVFIFTIWISLSHKRCIYPPDRIY